MKADADRHHVQTAPRADDIGIVERGPALGPRGSRLAFLLAAAALLGGGLVLLATGESEWPTFALGLGGLLVGRAAGIPERDLALVAFAFVAFAWPTAFFTSPIPRATSTLGHIAVAALLAWVLAGPVRRRWPATAARPWSRRWFAVPVLVLAIGIAWELGELVGDALFGTDLATRPFDTVTDLVADLLGAVLGLALYDRTAGGGWRESRR